MSKKRINKFNFNMVVDLYREGKIDEGCKYLYDNIWTFIDSNKSIVVYPRDRDNVANEAILEAHLSILKSLDREYAQIYNYVKIRVVSVIKKLYMKEHNHIDRYHSIDIDKLDEVIESTIGTEISNTTILEFLVKGILTLSDEEREIIYLRVFNFPNKSLGQLEAITNIDKQKLSRLYMRAIRKIKKYLSDNGINYENLF